MGIAVLVVDLRRAARARQQLYRAAAEHHRDHARRRRLCRARQSRDQARDRFETVVLVGFSYGAMATMYALMTDVADRMAPPRPSLRGPCVVLRAVRGPLRGSPDDGRAPADALRRRRSGHRSRALFGLRRRPARRRQQGRCRRLSRRRGSMGWLRSAAVFPADDVAPCDFEVQRDGSVHDRSTGVVMRNQATRQVLLGPASPTSPIRSAATTPCGGSRIAISDVSWRASSSCRRSEPFRRPAWPLRICPRRSSAESATAARSATTRSRFFVAASPTGRSPRGRWPPSPWRCSSAAWQWASGWR